MVKVHRFSLGYIRDSRARRGDRGGGYGDKIWWSAGYICTFVPTCQNGLDTEEVHGR